MGRACVDKTRCLGERYRFPSRVVRKTEDDHVSRLETFVPRFGLFAALGINAQQLDVVPGCEALGNFKPRGACLAINEDPSARGHDICSEAVRALILTGIANRRVREACAVPFDTQSKRRSWVANS